MITTASADSVLRSYYLDAVAEQLNKSANPLLAAIEQTSSDVWGKDVRKAVSIGVHGGIGALNESDYLPSSGEIGYAQFTATLKNLYGRVEISDKAIRASQSSDGAFVSVLNSEMDALLKSSSFNLGRMLFGDGTGKLASVSAVSGKTYTVDSVRNFAVGMVIDIANGSGQIVSASQKVVSIDMDAKSVTLDGASVAISSGSMYVHGSKDLELTGLGAVFAETGTLYGLSKSENAWLKPVIVKEVGTITENALQKAIDRVEASSGSKINFIVCSWGVRRALFEALSERRTLQPAELAGGVQAITFNGIPVVADRFCPEGTMYLLNTDDFRLHQLCDWQWLEGDNGKILHRAESKAAYSATLVKYAELMCYRPCGQAMLTGITEK